MQLIYRISFNLHKWNSVCIKQPLRHQCSCIWKVTRKLIAKSGCRLSCYVVTIGVCGAGTLLCSRVWNNRNGMCVCSAAAKSLQSCPTLWDPIEGSPPGSPVPGILQARTLEWVAISIFNTWKWKVKVKSLSRVRLLVTPWTAAHQAPPSTDFPGKSTRVGCHCLLWYILYICAIYHMSV